MATIGCTFANCECDPCCCDPSPNCDATRGDDLKFLKTRHVAMVPGIFTCEKMICGF